MIGYVKAREKFDKADFKKSLFFGFSIVVSKGGKIETILDQAFLANKAREC
jgi:hypothetical protein